MNAIRNSDQFQEMTPSELAQVEGGAYVNRVGTIDLFDCRASNVLAGQASG